MGKAKFLYLTTHGNNTPVYNQNLMPPCVMGRRHIDLTKQPNEKWVVPECSVAKTKKSKKNKAILFPILISESIQEIQRLSNFFISMFHLSNESIYAYHLNDNVTVMDTLCAAFWDIHIRQVEPNTPVKLFLYISKARHIYHLPQVEDFIVEILSCLNKNSTSMVVFNTDCPKLKKLVEWSTQYKMILIQKSAVFNPNRFFDFFLYVLAHCNHTVGYLASYFKYVGVGRELNCVNYWFYANDCKHAPLSSFL